MMPMIRKRFQMHLSTAVVLMIVAGCLVWANVQKRTPYDQSLVEYLKGFVIEDAPLEMFANPAKSPNPFNYWDEGYGWPKVAYYLPAFLSWNMDYVPKSQPYQISYSVMFLDIAIAILILFGVWFVCEWWIARRTLRIN